MPQRDYVRLARKAARKAGIPENLYIALIKQESGFNPNARSPANAVGLVQIHLPSHPDITEKQARDPNFALDWGAKYLASNYKRFGSWPKALAAYNAGAGAVEKYGGIPPYAETQGYVRNILGNVGKTPKPMQPLAMPQLGGMPGAQTQAPSLALQTLGQISQGSYDPVAFLSKIASTPPVSVRRAPSFGASGGRRSLASSGAPASADWGGSKPIADQFAGLAMGLGLKVASEKRDTQHTSSGGISDHWTGSKNAYAYDLSGSKQQMDQAAAQIAAQLGVQWDGKSELVATKEIGGYRVQLIWNTPKYGGHLDHVHLGVRRAT